MRQFSHTISWHILRAVIPYFLITWMLLSVILFVQQAGRYSDLLFNTAIPDHLIWQLTIALVPNVIAFTCPVAALVGVIIGLSRMQGDSEITALRAAGVGNLQITIPIVFLAILLSAFAVFINLKGVPFAAQIVRRVALQAALHKLESPIAPGTFNTDIEGFTVYVKDGNRKDGNWQGVFIYHDDKENNEVRLITAKEGRIDTSDDDSEIVLSDAWVNTFSGEGKGKIGDSPKKVVYESVKDLRLVVQTKRSEIIEKLSETKRTPEEMGLRELARHAATLEGHKRTDALVLWQRRILLSITPLLFSLLGVALVTKFNRGGRGFGVFLALVSLVAYYLLALLGEQLVRTEAISLFVGGLIPLSTSILVIVWLFLSQRLFISRTFSIPSFFGASGDEGESGKKAEKISKKSSYVDLTTGILDLDLIWNLVKNYLLTLGFLSAIFMIFTAFELWKFAGTIENGFTLLVTFLFFLIPFIYDQISPSALMIATLATYIIKSRQNEIVTWTAAGQSIYRLMLPCFILMILVGLFNFGIQEWVLTEANRKQDAIRDQIRSRNKTVDKQGKSWVASEDAIYSFKRKAASDNEMSVVSDLRIFEIDPNHSRLKRLLTAEKARWEPNKIVFLGEGNEFDLTNQESFEKTAVSGERAVSTNPFAQTITKPSHLDLDETAAKADNSLSAEERRTYGISLHKKYSTPFLPLIITLFSAPFALSLGRRGNVVTLGFAVVIWLLFMGTTNIFSQFGTSGYISPALAVWGPLAIFAMFGVYLLTRTRT